MVGGYIPVYGEQNFQMGEREGVGGSVSAIKSDPKHSGKTAHC